VSDPEWGDSGTAGAGARREYEKRRANREARIRARYPRTAGLRLALGQAPQHETAWKSGAIGEELVAESLEHRCGDRCRFLHDRRVPGSRANIDHIAIAPSGVWVIDAKNHNGKIRVDTTRKHGERLFIGRRNQTKLVDGLDRQVGLVRAAVGALDPDVPVRGAFCFTDADMPLLRRLSVAGYPLRWRKGMAKLLDEDGPVLPEQIAFLTRELALRFKSH
jgi:hypothetical protein